MREGEKDQIRILSRNSVLCISKGSSRKKEILILKKKKEKQRGN